MQRNVFVESQRLSSKGIAALNDALVSDRSAPVTSVALCDCDINVERLTQFRFSTSATTCLDLSLNRLRNVSDLYFDDEQLLPSALTELRLSTCELTADLLEALVRQLPPSLLTLDLSSNKMTADTARILMAHLPQSLKSLNLYHCWLGPAATAIVAAQLPVGLEELTLSNDEVHMVGALKFAERLPSVPGLRHLSLASCGMSSTAGATIVAALPDSLETLIMSDNTLQDAAHEAVAARALPRLRELDMAQGRFVHGDCFKLARGLPQTLTKLDLSSNGIDGDELLAIMARLPATFESLTLNLVDLRLHAPVALAQALPRALVELSLAGCMFGHDMLQHLLRFLPTERMQRLDLGATPLTRDEIGAVARWLGEARALVHLGLAGCMLDNRAMEVLVPALPPSIETLVLRRNVFDDDAGNVALLELIRAYGLEQRWFEDMIEDPLLDAQRAGFERTLAWWREVGDFVNRRDLDFPLSLRVAFDLDCSPELVMAAKAAGIAPGDLSLIRFLDAAESQPASEFAIESQRLSANGIAALNDALASSRAGHVTSLTFNSCDINLKRLAKFRFSKSAIKRIDFSRNCLRNNMGELPFDSDGPLLPDSLTELRLSACEMTADLVEMLAKQLPASLLALDLSSNKMTADTARILMAHLPQSLKSLNLYHCWLGPAATAIVHMVGALKFAERLPSVPGLRHLSLASCGMSSTAGATIVAALPDSLETLILSDNTLQDAAHEAVAARAFPRLRELSMAQVLARLPNTFESLALNWIDFRLHSTVAVAQSLPRTLVALSVAESQFAPGSVRHLIQYLPTDRMQQLDLSRLRLTRNEIGVLAAWLGTVHTLTHLALDRCDLDNAAMELLVPALPPALESLSLWMNNFDDRTVPLIVARRPPRLKHVDVMATHITLAAKTQLMDD
ncbi:hypothetical protein H9P43_002903 [Blastocladiella emersonii ATCC 22665]|nr:hypothetical protein H9P43_002903 [Blastocladiella emersonii ATCC 22665]